MRILIDTHVLIWWTAKLDRLPERVRTQLSDPGHQVFVSAATAWEIAIKVKKGKLEFDGEFLANFDDRVRDLAFLPLPILAIHCVAAGGLQVDHKDPFDRMIAAQARTEQLALISTDRVYKKFGIETIW